MIILLQNTIKLSSIEEVFKAFWAELVAFLRTIIVNLNYPRISDILIIKQYSIYTVMEYPSKYSGST